MARGGQSSHLEGCSHRQTPVLETSTQGSVVVEGKPVVKEKPEEMVWNVVRTVLPLSLQAVDRAAAGIGLE